MRNLEIDLEKGKIGFGKFVDQKVVQLARTVDNETYRSMMNAPSSSKNRIVNQPADNYTSQTNVWVSKQKGMGLLMSP